VNCIQSFDVHIQVEEERVLKIWEKNCGCVLFLSFFVRKVTLPLKNGCTWWAGSERKASRTSRTLWRYGFLYEKGTWV